MEDVLKAVMGVENQPFGILRISSPGARVNGKIAISDGSFIIGAVASDVITDATEVGYDAVRRLLTATDGNFAFLDTGGKRPAEFDDAIFVSISKLLASLPNLPDSPGELFDEKSLLDRVFGGELTVSQPSVEIQAQPEPEPAVQADDQIISKSRQSVSGRQSGQASGKPAWEMFQPLLSDSTSKKKGAETKQSGGNSFPYDFEDTGFHKQSLGKLRSKRPDAMPWYKELLRESLLSKTGLIWIAVIVLSLMATLFATTAVNQHSSLTIQKSEK